MNHIRIIDSRGGKRIDDRMGKSHTLCGGEMTDRDQAWRDCLRMSPEDLEKWLACPTCRAAVAEKR